MSTSVEKGNALEKAVQSIESLIFRSSPSLQEQDLRIEGKKRILRDGVHHEIDLYVEVGIAPGHKAVFIFECKNWSSPVNKNEIVIFSEKIRATTAQRGYFVAKDFTTDAMAQARQDPRIELLHATERLEMTPITQDLHSIFVDTQNPKIDLKVGIAEPGDACRFAEIDISTASATVNGHTESFAAFVNRWIEELVNRNLRTFQSQTLPADRYSRSERGTKEFERGAFYLADIQIGQLDMALEFAVLVLRPPIVSHFNIATKGRHIEFAPVDVPGGVLQYDVTIATPGSS